MFGADTLIDRFIENLSTLVPAVIIHNFEQGVKFSYGEPVKLCTSTNGLRIRIELNPLRLTRTGLHLFIPFVQSIEIDDTALERIVDMAEQSYTTPDGVSITLQGSIGYRILDLHRVWQTVHDYETSLANAAEGIVGEFIGDTTYRDIAADVPQFQVNILAALQEEAERWGIEVTRFYIPNITRTISLRHFGNPVT